MLARFCQRILIYSTVGKDRKYVEGCRQEIIYVPDEVLYWNICEALADGNEDWFDLVQQENDYFWKDAIDDIPDDGTEGIFLQLFQSQRDHIGLVLLPTDQNGVFRRIRLLFLDCENFVGQYETIVLM